MFSDRFRVLKIAGCAVLMATLAWSYADFATTRTEGYRACLADPASRDGDPLVFPLWTVTRIDGAASFAISRTLKDVPIAGDSTGLEVGDTVTIKGRFRSADLGVTDVIRIDHPLRPWKEGLSTLALLLGLLLVPRVFNWQQGRVVLRG